MRRKSQVADDLFKGSFNRFKTAVRVDIQRHTGIGVPHQVLQAFYIQPGLLNIGAEGVSQHMRCNARNRFSVRLLKLSLHATHKQTAAPQTFFKVCGALCCGAILPARSWFGHCPVAADDAPLGNALVRLKAAVGAGFQVALLDGPLGGLGQLRVGYVRKGGQSGRGRAACGVPEEHCQLGAGMGHGHPCRQELVKDELLPT